MKFSSAIPRRKIATEISDHQVTARHDKESYIRPQRAAEELPRLKEALERRGLEITILTSDILRADGPDAEPMLRAAAKLGIKRYRIGFHRYDLSKPILPQLAALEPVFRDLAAMNREIGIAGVYQNHSGAAMMGATIWDLHSLIRQYPPSELGCVFDVRHATVEGGEAWPVYFDLMKPHLGALSVKDFAWEGRRSTNVPLGQGKVDPEFFKMLRQTDFAGPISVHVEYLPNAKPTENVAALRRDFETLKTWLRA
jgi:sugar phosphate isomerase/epimerase